VCIPRILVEERDATLTVIEGERSGRDSKSLDPMPKTYRDSRPMLPPDYCSAAD